jgi:hypothetical protein
MKISGYCALFILKKNKASLSDTDTRVPVTHALTYLTSQPIKLKEMKLFNTAKTKQHYFPGY